MKLLSYLQKNKKKQTMPEDAMNKVTFTSTTNKVSATKVKNPCFPVKDAIAKHDAFRAIVKAKKGVSREDPDHAFETRNKVTGDRATTIIQASSASSKIAPCASGLVSVVLNAYNGHHNLILRPDDVWQAVLNQFSIYLTANAEELRDKVVDFKGQRQLTVKTGGTLFTTDFGRMAARMVDEEIVKNITDPDLVSWLLPSFTTTTTTDRVAASVSVMSAMQKYFKYKFELLCGIPSVTLLGTPEDWMKLRSKFDGLLQFELPGKSNIKKWHEWLAFIGDNLVQSAQGKADVKFWDRVASHHGGGSGPRFVSGWIAAFAVWSDEGEWQGVQTKKGPWDSFTSDFPIINTNDLPSGVVSVPVLVDDNGTEYDCMMLSGQFGMNIENKAVSPQTDWCIVVDMTY